MNGMLYTCLLFEALQGWWNEGKFTELLVLAFDCHNLLWKDSCVAKHKTKPK